MSEKYRKFCDFMSLWPSLELKTFSNGIKVNTYAYENEIIENSDFSNDSSHFWTDKAIEIQENWNILNKTMSIYSKFY